MTRPCPAPRQASQTTYNTADPRDGTLRVGQGGDLLRHAHRWPAGPRRSGWRRTPRGHQFFPDINADGGVLHAVWHDSRNDPAYSVQYPPGNATAKDATGFHRRPAAWTRTPRRRLTAAPRWARARLSTRSQMPNYEMFGDRQVPFHGDYNYVSCVGAFAFSAWTDTRQVRPGDDPRYAGGEGFDVLQCRTQDAAGTWSDRHLPQRRGPRPGHLRRGHRALVTDRGCGRLPAPLTLVPVRLARGHRATEVACRGRAAVVHCCSDLHEIKAPAPPARGLRCAAGAPSSAALSESQGGSFSGPGVYSRCTPTPDSPHRHLV